MIYTIAIVLITVLISVSAFSNSTLQDNLILWPKRMHSPKEYYRLLSCGFIHADWMHLIFNMYALYSFGVVMETIIPQWLHKTELLFLFLYLTSIIISSLPSFLNNRNNGYYRSLGASGGVASVIFAVIYYIPWNKISFFGLDALGIPGILFGVVYLAYSAYMSKRGDTYINHSAHFWGALYGFIFAWAIDPTHGQYFWIQITNPHF